MEQAVLEARERALVYNSTPSYFVLFRSQKAAAIAASSTIHPLRRELFKVGGGAGWGWRWASSNASARHRVGIDWDWGPVSPRALSSRLAPR
jgi:hypothetical protein